MVSSKSSGWQKRQKDLQVSQDRQADRKKLLARTCQKARATIPTMNLALLSGEDKKACHHAMVVLMVATNHAQGYQLTRQQLMAESGLSYRKLAAGLRFLKNRGLARFIPVRQNSRLSGWCYQVDLNGGLKPKDGTWALHYSQAEDVDREYRTARRRAVRRKAAGLPVTHPVRNAGKPKAAFSAPAVRTVKKRNALRASPLASPIMAKPSGKKKTPLSPCQGPVIFSFPNTPPGPEPENLTGEQNMRTRVFGAVEQINTRRMSDAEVESWWTKAVPAKMLDMSLPPGQRFAIYEKRLHMRRMVRCAGYLDKIAWHWAVTRQPCNRLNVIALTKELGRLYDPGADATGTSEVDKAALVHAYRRVAACNGATWAERSPRSSTEIIEHEYTFNTPDAQGMLEEVMKADSILQDAKYVLDRGVISNDEAVRRYVYLRAWVSCILGAHAARVFDHHCVRLGLDPTTNDRFKQWFVNTSTGRRTWKTVCWSWAMDPGQQRYVTGHTRNEWHQAVSDHAAASTLLAGAYDNMKWHQKTVRDYAIF